MGNSNYKCSCNKDSDQTENIINNLDDANNDPNKENENENFNMSQNFNNQNDLKFFVQGKKNSDNLNLKSSNNNTTQINPKFTKENLNQNDTYKIVLIQSVYRGHAFRNLYNSELKQKLTQEVNQLIKDLTEQYTKFNLKRAESLIGSKFDKLGYKTFYPENSKSEKEEKEKLFTYDYGKTYNCNLLIISGIIPSFYIGQVKLDYARHGYGVTLLSDGSKYEGYWRNNYFTGWGRYIDSDGTLYEGYFLNGKLNGKGIKKSLNGNVYIGDFVDNKREGTGKEETNEHIYEGEFKNDKKNGNGKLAYKLLKDTYEGEFKDNCITGMGFYTWANKDTYKGTFVNGKMHGKGLYKWPDGGEYYGEYVNNIKEGNGRFKWVNGKVFEGQFKRGKPSGFGKLKTSNREIDVEFKDGKLLTNIRDVIQKQKEKELNNKNVEDQEVN